MANKFIDISQISDASNYKENESSSTASDKAIIENLKKVSKLDNSQKTTVILLLKRIKEIIRMNKQKLEKMQENINIAKNVLDKEINDLSSETTLSSLLNYKIDEDVCSTSIVQFNEYYSQITELQYRRELLSYKVIFIKNESQSLDNQIEYINKYIISLQ